MTVKLSLIVAKSRNGVIGRDGALPWKISSDLKFFKATTMGKPILMGRVTWESLKGALPGRPNLILSRNENYKAEGAEVFSSVKELVGRGYELAGRSGGDEVIIMGGAQLYARLMPLVGRMYVTEVDAVLTGDAHFPPIFAGDWACISEKKYPASEKDEHGFTIKTYESKD